MEFEKLGVFYLGKDVDPATQKTSEALTLYDSKDLVTHALAVGMTGSGKTGLCVGLIEEAAIDGIPSIVIDPKGDLTNLLLTFPEMRGEDLLPWVNPEEARKKELTVAEFAEKQAAMWKSGLADWGQDLDRVKRLKDSADFTIYTPGSTAGVPVSILKTFSAPAAELLEDAELFQEKISTTVSSLLTLLKISADPLSSSEHILLSNIFDRAWRDGKDLDIASLIGAIQDPPFDKIGVLDLETFYPKKERMGLAMQLNNLIASPSFGGWLEGEALDINNIYHTQQGKPRVSIFSIAHLSEPERMFFVSLLLNQVLAWARSQSGTTSLRALLYMDEIFGYFPPVQNPPSKKPLLSLLKQARAFGLGVVLSTQNPVDIDYKGLSNIGTWFIGRLQTERDKEKMLEGLESAAGTGKFDRSRLDKMISGLGKRVFLMNNVHEDEPALFQTRWVLSYLAGPLTRDQIKVLAKKDKAALASVDKDQKTAAAVVDQEKTEAKVIVPAGIEQYYLNDRSVRGDVVYRPVLVAGASVNYSHTKSRVTESKDLWFEYDPRDGGIRLDWAQATPLKIEERDLEREPFDDSKFGDPDPELLNAKNYKGWLSDLTTYIYQETNATIYYDPNSKAYSDAGESEQDFTVRNRQARREARDEAVDKLRKKYATKIKSAQEKVRKAGLTVEREEEQAEKAKMQSLLGFGTTLLGAFTGKKLLSSTNINRAGSAFRGVTRSSEQAADVDRAKETLAAYEADLQELEKEMEIEVTALTEEFSEVEIERIEIRPKKSDINAHTIGILWKAE